MAGGVVVKAEWPRTSLPLNNTFELQTILQSIAGCCFSRECSYRSQTETDERSWRTSLGLEVGQVGGRKQIFDPDVSVTFVAPSPPNITVGDRTTCLTQLINLQNFMLPIMLLLDIMLAIVHSTNFMQKQLLAQFYCLPPQSVFHEFTVDVNVTPAHPTESTFLIFTMPVEIHGLVWHIS